VGNQQTAVSVTTELDRLTSEFFGAVSFEAGKAPAYKRIRTLLPST